MNKYYIIALLAVAVLAVILLTNAQTKKTEPINSEVTPEASNSESVADKTYTNFKYGFSLTYPGYYMNEKISLEDRFVIVTDTGQKSLSLGVTEEQLEGYKFNVWTGDQLFVEYHNDNGWVISDSQGGFTFTDDQKESFKGSLPDLYTTKSGYTTYYWSTGDGGTLGRSALVEATSKEFLIHIGLSRNEGADGNLKEEIENILDTLVFN
jgi:hypothetical protein